jgi:hypothetical protein
VLLNIRSSTMLVYSSAISYKTVSTRMGKHLYTYRSFILVGGREAWTELLENSAEWVSVK